MFVEVKVGSSELRRTEDVKASRGVPNPSECLTVSAAGFYVGAEARGRVFPHLPNLYSHF